MGGAHAPSRLQPHALQLLNRARRRAAAAARHSAAGAGRHQRAPAPSEGKQACAPKAVVAAAGTRNRTSTATHPSLAAAWGAPPPPGSCCCAASAAQRRPPPSCRASAPPPASPSAFWAWLPLRLRPPATARGHVKSCCDNGPLAMQHLARSQAVKGRHAGTTATVPEAGKGGTRPTCASSSLTSEGMPRAIRRARLCAMLQQAGPCHAWRAGIGCGRAGQAAAAGQRRRWRGRCSGGGGGIQTSRRLTWPRAQPP